MTETKDRIYANPLTTVEAFRFDAAVADVFQDMIERSVPGYGLILQLIASLAERYAAENTRVYDLGCSLGASTLQLRRHIPAGCEVIGVDNSAAMVERCRSNLERDHSAASWSVHEEDIRDTVISNASIVVLNFTLQFVPDDERKQILNKIAEGLVDGGILLLAEKVAFDNESEQTLMTDLHHDFKRYQGYSDLEVAQKRSALENVLVPNTEQVHIDRLAGAGFNQAWQCVRCLNFEAFIAIR